MEQAVLVWALWITSGGKVNGGYLMQTQVVANFVTVQECERVRKLVSHNAKWSQCIQGHYVLTGK